MSKPIEWSPRSKQDYLYLLDYLHTKWGADSIRKFNNRLQSVLDLIAERPEIYPSTSKKRKVRRCVLSKQTSLHYRIKKDKIELITLFDTRRHPSTKKV